MNITAYRRTIQIAFILLVFLMPVLYVFRYDTATKELIILGQVWSLGLKEAFYADQFTGSRTYCLAVLSEGYSSLDQCFLLYSLFWDF